MDVTRTLLRFSQGVYLRSRSQVSIQLCRYALFLRLLGRNLLVQCRDRVTHNRTISGWFRQAFGITTYSFIGFPFIGSSNDAPFFSKSSFRLSSDPRTNRSFPKSPANMFPLTNADMFPNIGRMVMRGSSGKIDLRNSLEFSSGRGIFTRGPRNQR